MPKFVPDDVIDLLLAGVATATLMSVTSDISTPANLTNMLADSVMASGDFVIDNDTSGRKVTVATKANVPIDGLAGTNNALHVVLSLGGTILDVTTCTTQPLTNGGSVTFPAWTHSVADPT